MNKYKFSLVMATYGRKEQVGNFLKSIINSNYDLSLVQVIIVDQNNSIDLTEEINPYVEKLNIVHIRSKVKGLSKNRNIGLDLAEGEIIAFPDDDCEYLHNTLMEVENLFKATKADVVMGRIIERDGGDSLRIWPKVSMKITKSNFYTKCSSITMFIKNANNSIRFNEKLGVGATFGSCEDSSILYAQVKAGKKVVYIPEIKIYHPHYDSSHNMSLAKVESYGLGFGGFVRSNLDVTMMLLFVKATAYHLIKCLIGLLTLNKEKVLKSSVAFTSRIKGFIKYK